MCKKVQILWNFCDGWCLLKIEPIFVALFVNIVYHRRQYNVNTEKWKSGLIRWNLFILCFVMYFLSGPLLRLFLFSFCIKLKKKTRIQLNKQINKLKGVLAWMNQELDLHIEAEVKASEGHESLLSSSGFGRGSRSVSLPLLGWGRECPKSRI